MKENRKRNILLLALSAIVLAAAAFALMLPQRGASPGADAQASAGSVVLGDASDLIQTLVYTRCGHTVTRRVTAPVELYGKNMEEIAAMYPEWRITEFSAAKVKMDRQPEMFCPDHMVLMPDGAGLLCVYENKYGEAMSLIRETDVSLSSLPSAMQEEAAHGIGFSTAEELEMWLEGVES